MNRVHAVPDCPANWCRHPDFAYRLGGGVFITSLLPGDAAQMILGQNATPVNGGGVTAAAGSRSAFADALLPLADRHGAGDLAPPFASHLPVSQLVAQRIPATFELAGITTLNSARALALIIGIIAAMNRGSRLTRALVIGTMATVAVPEFLVATVAVPISPSSCTGSRRCRLAAG